MSPAARVSVHGGHSGEFCQHAADTLEAVVRAYVRAGFTWVGLTEHMPPLNDDWLYPDERAAGQNARTLYRRFGAYIDAARSLQRRFAGQIDLYVGCETETYPGSAAFITHLVETFRPDYLVGSLHHVGGLSIDWSPEDYEAAAAALGGVDALYRAYFDLQYEMLAAVKPRVVGHFDLVRIFDRDYARRLQEPEIARRVRRNLERVKALGAMLDFNVRALTKGADEPYVTRAILRQARELAIPVVPGDDSHGVATVGNHIDTGIRILTEMGFDTDWPRP